MQRKIDTTTGIASPRTIFDEKSVSLESAAFFVGMGEVVVLQAIGFAEWASREPGEILQNQVARIQRILYKDDPRIKEIRACGVYNLSNYRGLVLAFEDVTQNGCTWCMSSCNNLIMMTIPGDYRLVLNDTEALGQVRIYLHRYSKNDLGWVHPQQETGV